MWVNTQLAIANRMRTKASLEAMFIQEKEEFVKTEYLSDIEWLWNWTKTILVNKWIKTYSELKKLDKEWLKNLGILPVSIVAIERFIERKNKEELELEQIKREEEIAQWNTIKEVVPEPISDEFNI